MIKCIFPGFSRIIACLGLVTSNWLAPSVFAQDYNGYALEAANRSGLLERCAKQGFAKQQDIADALSVLHARPQLPPPDQLKAATDEGVNGIVLAADQHIALNTLARDQGLSIREMCEAIAASANMAASTISPADAVAESIANDPGSVNLVDAITCRLDAPTYNSFAMALEGEQAVASKRHWRKLKSANPFMNEY